MLDTHAEQPQNPTALDAGSAASVRTREPRKPVTHTSAALHAKAAALIFRATTRDHSGASLGILVDGSGSQQHLGVTPDGVWSLSGAKSFADPPVLLYESAANVLRGGAMNADGTISYAGGDYLIALSVDGALRTARLATPPRVIPGAAEGDR